MQIVATRMCVRSPVVVRASADRNGMQSFRGMKKAMLVKSIEFSLIGSGVAAVVKGVPGIEAFVYGSALGIANQWLLQSEVEQVGSIKNIVQLMNNMTTRMALTVATLYMTYLLLGEHVEAWQAGGAFTGFLMSKLGLIHGYLHEELGPAEIQDDDRGTD